MEHLILLLTIFCLCNSNTSCFNYPKVDVMSNSILDLPNKYEKIELPALEKTRKTNLFEDFMINQFDNLMKF